MNFLVRLFRRETSSNEYIPEIDGLRFLAILMVVLFHIDHILTDVSAPLQFSTYTLFNDQIPNIFKFGYQGVQLFFVISGFVLAIPFMRYYLGISDKKIPLRKYFLRRLERLEPPYIISLLIIFLVAVYSGELSFRFLLNSLLASMAYLHTIIFPGEYPHINGVTWSLETEVQYYILSPLIVWALCRIRGKFMRRLVLLILIVACSILGWCMEFPWEVKTWSLAWYLQYFLSGILLCDLYLLEDKDTKYLNSIFVFVIGIVLLFSIICFDNARSVTVLPRIISPLLILGFYIVVFWNAWWRRIFRFDAFTLIGGMCYTIYLLHYPIISSVARHSIDHLYFADYRLFFIVQMTISLIVVLFVSSGYFLLIEKPCMKKDWHRTAYTRIRSWFFGVSKTVEKQFPADRVKKL